MLKQFDIPKSKADADLAQAQIRPGFGPDTDRFQREWTNLDLRSMAKAAKNPLRACLPRDIQDRQFGSPFRLFVLFA